MRLLLASRNSGKLREFAGLLPGFTLIAWPAEAPEIPEEGAFFRDNAAHKAAFARDWWQSHGSPSVDAVLADDSGLCVDALWGGPGVLSARFASGLPNHEKNRALLEMLEPGAPRTARFVCVLALAPMADSGDGDCTSTLASGFGPQASKEPHQGRSPVLGASGPEARSPKPEAALRFYEACVEGSLASEPRGERGFGYDPIFVPEGLHQTFGELPDEVKARLSHRAKAARALREALAAER
ncbi:MAG: non-canonical purine NTP pyrophosphatase [Acidobacteriota bacterium]|nr:non-canonical purine NTP pyrophosphatase [Acidobacteriota bacterium]